MKKIWLTLPFLINLSVNADDWKSIPKSSEVIFEDKFERDEKNQGKEDIGNGWTSNSSRRAKGNKQADLIDGYLKVTTHEVADHAAVIFHDAGFKNGAVSMKFKLGPKDSINLDFVDRKDKSTWAGHLFNTIISTEKTILKDGKYGVFDMSIRKRRQEKTLTDADKAQLKASTKSIPNKIEADAWHKLFVSAMGDTMSVYVNEKKVGEFKTPAVEHPTKRMISLTAAKTICIDDLKIYKVD